MNVQPYRQISRVRFIVPSRPPAARLYEIDVLFRLSYIKKKEGEKKRKKHTYISLPMALVFRRIDGNRSSAESKIDAT